MFDEVAALSVGGVSKSAIARVKGIAWNAVDRWLEEAAAGCRSSNEANIGGVDIQELRADEIRTIVGGKKQPMWIFTAKETRTPAMQAGLAKRRLTFRDVFSSRSRFACVTMLGVVSSPS